MVDNVVEEYAKYALSPNFKDEHAEVLVAILANVLEVDEKEAQLQLRQKVRELHEERGRELLALFGSVRRGGRKKKEEGEEEEVGKVEEGSVGGTWSPSYE